jgi:apolipoprotein N-acyltransferase
VKPASAIAVATLSGAALTLAFPEPDAFWVAAIALIPLLALSAGGGARRGFVVGTAYGIGFFGVLLSWISIVGWIAWLLLVVMQAVFIGLFGLVWGATSKDRGTVVRIFVPAALWVAVEYLRSIVPITGFTWGDLTQSQHNFPYLLKTAGLAGGWLVAFVLVAVNASLLELTRSAQRRERRAVAVPAAVLVVALAGPAFVAVPEADGQPLRVAIVQGNVPDIPPSFEKDLLILGSHASRTEDLAADAPDLVVWPESSVGIDPFRDEEVGRRVTAAADAVDAPMIVGGNLQVDDDHYQVMAFQVEPNEGIVDRYQKTHLVPFGEYVPGRRFLSWLPMLDQVPNDAIAGTERTLFRAAGGTIATVLSFEGDFGSLVRRRIGDGGRLLIVATNTSTWGRSWASAQHAAFSQVRAAENGVWVVHAALSGISEFIAPDGTVAQRAPLFEPATMIQEMRFGSGASFYARTGDWFPIGALIISVAWMVISRKGRRGQGSVT